MGELTKIDQTILPVLHGMPGLPGLDKPFAQKIYLLDVHIAGTQYVENIKEIEPQIQENTVLHFFRESENEHDPFAIVVKNETGQKIGYIPRSQNLIPARLMDAGKSLNGIVQSKENIGNWLKITIKIFLND